MWAALRGLLACAVLGLASSARAIPAQPPSWNLVNADLPVVEDGVLLFRYSSGGSPGAAAPVFAPTVKDAMSMVVPGSAEMLTVDGAQNYRIYRFESVLSASGQYGVTSADMISSAAFEKGGPLVDALDASAAAVEGIQLQPRDQRCCTGTTLLSPGGPALPPCIVVEAQEQAQVRVSAVFAANDSSSRQYLYHATLTKPELMPNPDWLPAAEAMNGWTLWTAMPADELCYRVEAYRLTDGKESVIAEGCAPAPPGPLGLMGPAEETIAAVLQVRGCLMAPQGLTAAWCEVNRMACTDADPMNPDAMACDTADFERVCAAYPPSDMSLVELVEQDAGNAGGGAGKGGAGGSGSTAGKGGVTGGKGGGMAGAGGIGASGTGAGGISNGGTSRAGGAAGASQDSAAASDGKRSSGCSAAPHANAQRALPTSLALLALVIIARRRRIERVAS